MKPKRVAFFPAHPAQIWILRPVAEMTMAFAEVEWFLRDKDICLELADDLGMEYSLMTRAGSGIVGNGIEFFRSLSKTLGEGKRRGIDLWVTKYGACHLAALLQGRASLTFIDDDVDVIPFMAWTSFPFVDGIIAPEATGMGRWSHRTSRFEGCFELSYLHSDVFSPDSGVLSDLGIGAGTKYGIVRLSSLSAHHDVGKRGIGDDLVDELLKLCSRLSVRLFITSEKPLEPSLDCHKLTVPVSRIHSVLAHSEFLVADSQTMIEEAAVLGIPALRLNDFVGRISVIDELEEMGLAFGFLPGQERDLLAMLGSILSMDNRKTVFQERRAEMLRCWKSPVPLMVEKIHSLLDASHPDTASSGRASCHVDSD